MKAGVLTALALGIALGACDRSGPDVPAPTSGDAAETAQPAQDKAAPSAPLQAAQAVPATYDFYLLTREGKPVEDPRIVSTQEHPCGPIDLVRVPSIPMNDPVFMPYFVVEFDAMGKELVKWGVPSDVQVTALDGNRLKFQDGDASYWVVPDGTLEKTATDANAEAFTTTEAMFDCPALPTFKNSEAEQCFRVKDAAGAERRIAKEGVCS